MLRKVEGHSTFPATCNATLAVAKGVLHVNFLLQVARKIASCNMAFSGLYSRLWPAKLTYHSLRTKRYNKIYKKVMNRMIFVVTK